MLRRKAINRIFFSTIIFFIVFTLYSMKFVDKVVTSDNSKDKVNEEIIYTLNSDNYISKTSVYVSKVLSLEDRVREKLEIMVKDNDKNVLLPSYFKPILPQNTRVLDVVVEDCLIKVYFSKELNNINKEQSEKMIEAIVYTVTDENILGIEIYVNGQMLKYVPNTKKVLPTILTKDIGINKSYDINASNDISKVVMMYYTNDNDNYYEVPVTKYVNDDREKLEIIFDEFGKMSDDKSLISMVEGINVLDYSILDDRIVIDVNKVLNKEEQNLVFKSIFSNYGAKSIDLLVNGEKKVKKTRNALEN